MTESLRSQEKAVQEAHTKCRDLEKRMCAVREQVTHGQVRDTEELERHRAVEAERLKWEHSKLAWWPSCKHSLDQDGWNLERSLPQHPRAARI